MYDKRRVKKPTECITLDYILSKVTEYDIYAHYLGQFKVGAIYNSPFRKDKNPSFGVYYSKRTKQLLFKDHGTGECGNVIKFVSLFTGITNYNDILKDIIKQLHITPDTTLDNSKQYTPSTDTVIGVVRQDFTYCTNPNCHAQRVRSLAHFASRDAMNIEGLSEETLKKFNVNSIKYYLCNGIVKGIYKPENPMYAYKVYNNFKIYRPLADKYTKWRNNLTEYDIQGYKQLPKTGDILVITKSMKDVMCLYEMGIPAISPSSESTFIPNDILEGLKKRFKRIIILFDRDPAGVRYSRKISLKMGLEACFIPKYLNAKDVSDAIKLNNFEIVKKEIEKIVNKQYKHAL